MSASRLVAAVFGLLACASVSKAQAQTPPADLVYSRIKPCRLFDTTKTQKIPANGARSFLVSGAGDFARQGGSANGCGVPASAQAVSLNITAINGAAAGSLTAFPYAQTTGVATLRFPVSAPESIGGIVDLAQNRVTFKTTSTVNAIGDVTGYYAPQMWAHISFNGGTMSQSRMLSARLFQTGIYIVRFDRDVRSCVVHVTSDASGLITAGYTNQDDQGYVQVNLWTSADLAVNNNFYVSVTC